MPEPSPDLPSAPNPKPQRALSPAQLAANRANARRSTGPRSPGGKAVARLNGLTHGCSAQLPILPGEDPAALQQRLDAWTDELGAQTEAERYLVAAAVHASWRIDRARNAEVAALTRQVLDAEEGFDDRQAKDVAFLTERLANDPALVVQKLRSSSLGCRWLMAHWEALAERLQAWTSFEPTQRLRAIHLLGKRPTALFDDPVVARWDVAYLGALLDNTAVDVDKIAAILRDDRPEEMDQAEFERRIQEMSAALPDRRRGHAALKQYIAQAREELAERLDLIEAREQRDRALEVEGAAFDASAAGASRLRYEMAHERALRAALRELRAVQELRREPGGAAESGSGGADTAAPSEPEPPDGAPSEPETVPDPPQPTPPCVTSVAPTEPNEPGSLIVTSFKILDPVADAGAARDLSAVSDAGAVGVGPAAREVPIACGSGA